MTTIKVKAPKLNRELTTEFDFGADATTMIKLFGEAAVYNAALDAMTIALQGYVRSRMTREGDGRMNDAAIIADVAKWKPGVRTITRDPVKTREKLRASLAKLSDDERAELLAAYKPAIVKGKK